MKIAVWHNLPSGGGKRALYLHVRGLVERGHEVEVWTPQTGRSSYLPLSDLVPEHIVHFNHLPYESSNIFTRALRSYHRVKTDMERMDEACAQAAQEMKQGHFDVLFVNTCHYYYVPPIGRYAQLPCVLYLQEPNRPLYEARPRLQWIGRDDSEALHWNFKDGQTRVMEAVQLRKSRLYARYEMRNVGNYANVLVNSFFSRESLLRTYGSGASVCYLGIDTASFVDQIREREDFVIGIGALQAHKNIEFVIEAIGAMQGVRPRLVWVGNVADQGYRESLESLARSLGVCLELKIMVSDSELVDLLNRAAMMAYAPRLEPFGYAPLEANACGLPVVAVAEGGVRETVTDGLNGLLVGGEPQEMAEAIQRLMEHPALARQLGENGSRLVRERWSLDAATHRLEQHLQHAIASAPTAISRQESVG